MANQFNVDRSKEFASKMTLITDVSSDKYLKQYRQHLQNQVQLESIYREN
jgi:hypothetical protein